MYLTAILEGKRSPSQPTASLKYNYLVWVKHKLERVATLLTADWYKDNVSLHCAAY